MTRKRAPTPTGEYRNQHYFSKQEASHSRAEDLAVHAPGSDAPLDIEKG